MTDFQLTSLTIDCAIQFVAQYLSWAQIMSCFVVVEMIGFSAGSLAAIILLTTVLVMILAKTVCVLTGYDRLLTSPSAVPGCEVRQLNDPGDDEREKMLPPNTISSKENYHVAASHGSHLQAIPDGRFTPAADT